MPASSTEGQPCPAAPGIEPGHTLTPTRLGDAWPRYWESDGLSIRWPETFDVTPLIELMAGFERAMALELGETATKEAKKLAARAVLPNVTEDMRASIDQEIDALEYVTEEERRKDDLNAKMAKLTGAMGGVADGN